MNDKELALNIIENVGGKENIIRVWNCMTRIRFNLKDYSLIDSDNLKKLDRVINIQKTPSQFQIIIGKDVDLIANQINEILGNKVNNDSESIEISEQKEKKNFKSVLNSIIETISSIFSPILPAIIGAGMMKVILSLITTFNIVSSDSGLFMVFQWIGDSAFYFLPFLLAVSSARKFKVNEFVSLCLAGVLMAPSLLAGAVNQLPSLKFLGIDLPYMNYSSSVIPIILSVLLMSYVDKLVSKILPRVLKAIFQSMIDLIITVPIMLIIIAPLGFYAGELLSKGLIQLFEVSGPIAGALLGGFNPLIIMTGMHYAFMPAAIQSIATNGYDNFWLPFALISNLAQTGAIMAVFFKYKNQSDKSIAISTGISAFFGISEPGLYGITLKLKKPLYAAMIGGAVGGFVSVWLGVKTYSFTAPSIFALPTYISPSGNKNSFYAILIGCAVSLIVSFILTIMFKFDLQEKIEDENFDKQDESIEESDLLEVYSPMHGEVKNIKEVPDQTFSDEIIGKGTAIIPLEGVVYAPFNGEVNVLFKTKHAIGLTSNTGVELLIHIGLDTVELEGKYFKSFVNSGDKVNKGDKLIEFDKKEIEKLGYNMITPIVITNYTDFESINVKGKGVVDVSELLIEIS